MESRQVRAIVAEMVAARGARFTVSFGPVWDNYAIFAADDTTQARVARLEVSEEGAYAVRAGGCLVEVSTYSQAERETLLRMQASRALAWALGECEESVETIGDTPVALVVTFPDGHAARRTSTRNRRAALWGLPSLAGPLR